MDNKKTIDAIEYLNCFDEILNGMANEMLSQPITNNITINFINCMIPHHQAAIDMCENLLEYTNFLPLQEIAKNIIKTQTNGIKKMKYIMKTTPFIANTPRDVNEYMKQYFLITENMIIKMKNSPRTSDVNLDFIGEMITHHEGAILMCDNLIKYPINPRLKDVADSIIYEQSKGIKELGQIRQMLK